MNRFKRQRPIIRLMETSGAEAPRGVFIEGYSERVPKRGKIERMRALYRSGRHDVVAYARAFPEDGHFEYIPIVITRAGTVWEGKNRIAALIEEGCRQTFACLLGWPDDMVAGKYMKRDPWRAYRADAMRALIANEFQPVKLPPVPREEGT